MLAAHIRLSLTDPMAALSVSDSIEPLLGFKPEDFLGGKVSLRSRIHAHDQDIANDLFSTETDKISGTFNIRLRQANGRIRCIKGHYTKEPDPSGKNIILELQLQDAKSLWQGMKDQPMMAYFKAMMENTDDYIYFKDRNHVFNGASQTLVSITAPSEHWTDLLGQTDYDVFPEEYADVYYRLEKQVFAGIPVAHEIQETLDNEGNKGWVDNRKYPIRNELGEIIGLFGIARVITEQKLAEQALLESQEALRESQLIAELGTYVLDIRTGLWESSDVLDQLFGIDKTYERSVAGWTALIHPDDRTMIDECIGKAILGYNGALDKEFRIIRHDNQTERWMHGLCKLEFNAEGQPVKMRGTIQDITERKQTEAALLKSEANLRAMLDNSPYLTWLKDPNGRYITINKVFANYLRLDDPGQAIGKTDLDLQPKEQAEKYRADDIEVMTSFKQKHTEEIAFDGKQTHWVETFKTPIIDSHGNVLGTVGFASDITERKSAENELRIAAAAFESQESMIITDANGVILRVNHAFVESTGYTAEEVIGQTPRMLQSGRHNADFYRAMWESIHRTGVWQGEIWDKRKNGEVYPKWLYISAVKGSDGVVTHYVGSHIDITEHKAAEEKIKILAFFDPLTRLPNRRLLLDRLQQALASSLRSGREGALLFIDLDNFKTLNDTLGHDMGDMLLQQVAQRLESCIREGDTVARLGGDEFIVLLEDLSEQALEAAAQTEAVGEKILAALNQPYQLGAREYRSTPSIGATLFNSHQQAIDELLIQADIAMYQAKKAGRNTLRFFDPQMQASITARAALESELRKAIESRQFQLYYQIQIDSSGHPLGAEALIRWLHPERGLMHPEQFIALLEETGLILPVGRWVLETACAQIKAWQQQIYTRNLVLAVNVSAKQFRQADFVAQVQAAIQHHAINPILLKLELTESVMLENVKDTIATMKALNEIGVQLSLDDFGTGYSSLQYLKQLPLDQLKIDQSFIRDLNTNSSDKAIVRTIISMAKSLKLGVIAEGVETEEQRQLLLSNGCTQYQGYLFSKPVPIEWFEQLLKRN